MRGHRMKTPRPDHIGRANEAVGGTKICHMPDFVHGPANQGFCESPDRRPHEIAASIAQLLRVSADASTDA